MTEAVQSPSPLPVGGAERPVVHALAVPREAVRADPRATDQDGWALLLVPTTICLIMFVIAFWW
jgi:hypothetical protein